MDANRIGGPLGRIGQSHPPRIYNLFPLVIGDIEQLIQQLPRIAGMGFDWVFVNSLAASGFSGSLYAIKDPHALDPRFGGGELLPALRRLSDAAAANGLRLMVDLVINHASLDAPLLEQHPDWFAREADGGIKRPSAIDPADANRVTVWGDLAEIDYANEAARPDLIRHWQAYIADLVDAGVRGFRCDAAYKVPAAVWRELIQFGHDGGPDVIFAAETLGCRLEEADRLAPAGFDYLFNSVKWWDLHAPWALEQQRRFRRIAPTIGFPESHDTVRLGDELGIEDATVLRRAYALRYALAAAFSGGVLMPVGYEFGSRRRLDVVASTPWPREAPAFDLSPDIAAINRALAALPAGGEDGALRRVELDGAIVLVRSTADGAALLLVARPDIGDGSSIQVDRAKLAALAGVAEQAIRDCTPGNELSEDRARLTLEPLSYRLLVVEAPKVTIAPAPAEPVGPAPHPDWSPAARIAIEQVWPELDGGRFPAKYVVGDRVEIWADIFRDGHDVVGARVRYLREGQHDWNHARLLPYDNDRWTGDFIVDRPGRWLFTIEAWTDPFESWRRDTLRKYGAGQDVALDLVEGLQIVEQAARDAVVAVRPALDPFLQQLRCLDGTERGTLLLSAGLRAAMATVQPKRDLTAYERTLELTVDRRAARFAAWYEMFPRSQGTDPGRGTNFDEAALRLPEIRELGFDVVYLVPIHPIGRKNRKGPNNSLTAGPGDPGSPYAIGAAEGGHTAVHPDLGGLDGFRRFQAAVHANGMEVALDFAVQCSPDHPWLQEHPDWFNHRPDGSIKYAENPPKKYEDIVNVEFYGRHRQALWDALRDAVLFWVREGVKIFRVDNPHTKPLPFWEWMIREVQAEDPDVIFLSEAFTRPKMMKRLAKLGFTQSYTYFTWRNDKAELTEYVTELAGHMRTYYRPNFFPTTPDILPKILQDAPVSAFRIRFLLAALLSGTYGIYNGFELGEGRPMPGKEEYGDSEKYQFKVWDWDRPGNIKPLIAEINRLRRQHPQLQDFQNIRFRTAQHDQVLFFEKYATDFSPPVLVAISLDPVNTLQVSIDLAGGSYQDLLQDRIMSVPDWPTITLTPDQPCLLLRAVTA